MKNNEAFATSCVQTQNLNANHFTIASNTSYDLILSPNQEVNYCSPSKRPKREKSYGEAFEALLTFSNFLTTPFAL
jgi:hypothetical protein